ncbi:hypothetical protein BU14_0493s0002 [Porphyra umbilicalis]|uniref:Galactosyltransferase C-terminal domain-containing protein n=1 Tax=Porphyra umbilicalis TaxID=2786 RepID=A0A1X6NTF4_PORUM|nr:hypothetical protein BU14_0493s0002 [Porphyra umbilicalis]|eukprot:OSX71857.1 hypothetical protein BU14_0493s0002 [Porphyra umbilicalis]
MAGYGDPLSPQNGATGGGGSSLPSAHAVTRKLAGRLRRDARVYLGRHPAATAAAAAAAVLTGGALLRTLVCRFLLDGGDGAAAAAAAATAVRFAPRGDVAATCVCVDGRTSAVRWARGLVAADTVFRGHPVTPPPPTCPPTKWRLPSRRSTGGPRASSRRASASAAPTCTGVGGGRGLPGARAPGDPWLFVGGAATGLPGGAVGELAPAPCGAVLAAPWRGLPEEAHRVVAEEGDFGDAWWRNRRQWQPPARPAAADAAAPLPTPVQEWWLRDGVTVIAACQDRSDALVEAVTSWLAAAGVDEVVLLDWSSAAPIAGVLAAAAPAAVADPRLLLARVAGQGRGWVLSRAYNVAARLATRSTLLKVDCDTVLSPTFVAAHPTTDARTFYAGDWRSLTAPTADERLHMNGLLLVRRADFAHIHGYDERIVTYGWDDSDIVGRLAAFRTPRPMDYGRARHVRHAASRRTGRQGAATLLPPDHPLAAAVEIQRNRLLLKPPRLPPWGPAARGVVYNVRSVWLDVRNGTTTAGAPPRPPPPPPPSGDGTDAPAVAPKRYYLLRVANEVPSAADLVSEADGADASKRALRIILKSRRGVPAYHKDLPLDFYLGLAARYAAADAGASPFARVDVIPGGGGHGGGGAGGAIGPAVAAEPPSGCAARLLTLAALRAATSPPLPSFFAAAAAANVSGGGSGGGGGGGGGGLPVVGRAGVASAALGRLSASFRHRRDGPGDGGGAARPRAAPDGMGDAGGGNVGGGGGGTGGPLLFETAGDAIPAGPGPDGPTSAAAVAHPPSADATAADAAAAAEPVAVPVTRHRVAATSVWAALAAAADGVTAAGAAGAAARPPGSAPATAIVTCGVDVRAGADADGVYVAAVRHQLRALVPDGALRSAVVAGALRRAAAADAAASAAAAAPAGAPDPRHRRRCCPRRPTSGWRWTCGRAPAGASSPRAPRR